MSCDYVPPLVEQLHGPDPTAGSDCAIACAKMAIRFATCGALDPGMDAIREQAGLDVGPDYSTTMSEYTRAVNCWDDEARGRGYDGIGAGKHEQESWDDQLAPLIRDEVKWATAFIDYGTLNDRAPDKTGDKNFRGSHAIGLFGYKSKDETGSEAMVKVFDPLCDGRSANIPKGPVWYPMGLIRDAADAYAGGGSGNATWCATPRSKLLEPDEPPEPVDPCSTAYASDRSAFLELARETLRGLDGGKKLARLIRSHQGNNPEGLKLPVHAGVTPDE